MLELAAVIAEHKFENYAAGWFKLPWRDGWNAVGLAAQAIEDRPNTDDYNDHYHWLRRVVRNRETSNEVYWEAEDRLHQAIDPLTRAGLRCLQILIAKSSGGGEVYNSILVTPFAIPPSILVADFVMHHRCVDAIGTTPSLKGDGNDRLRRAFTTAWQRGLYQAAYALPQAR